MDGSHPAGPEPWVLTLYVRGASPNSTAAIRAVRDLCDEELAGRFTLTVVDCAEHPERLAEDHIVALPTLVKHAPSPERHLVGHLTDVDALHLGLDLGPARRGGV